ncbi:MAG: alpha/beta hydrolase [Nocardia sp.]|nr:alpha/beta hydrolase [Nocardia sp.]
MLRGERFDELVTLFGPALAATVSVDTIRVAWAAETAKIGGVEAVGPTVLEPLDAGATRTKVPVTGGVGGLVVRMVIDSAGLLQGFRLAPPEDSAWEPPRYAVPRRFREREVIVESGSYAVPGTLTMPKGGRAKPAMVLVSSGAMDRDVTTGPNKPFKDLAWGLASRGIAVLRFDKVNFVHTEVNHEQGFTMVEEYVHSAKAAVRLLRQEPGIDPDRVYVAGHSGGGKAAPRIAAVEPSVAGVVILAGDTAPMTRAALRVFDYIADLEPGKDFHEKLAALMRAVEVTESPTLSPETPASELLFGMPASYWLDMWAYDQVATAAALDKPILILQGGRDYQVTVADDLPGWQQGLAGRADVTIHVHDADDHMFYPGTGRSAPSDVERPNHVDAAIVADIADWIAPESKRGPLARLLNRR